MRFTQFLLLESVMGTVDGILTDVLSQYAEEDHWNYDAIMQSVERRLNEIPEFAEDRRRLDAALELVSDQLKPMSEDSSGVALKTYTDAWKKGSIPKPYKSSLSRKTKALKDMKKKEKK